MTSILPKNKLKRFTHRFKHKVQSISMPLKEIILESKERSQAPDIFKLDNLELLTESANHGILVFLLVWTSEMD